ncbi:hypothetical protein BJX99DRAFT_222593 [Aspergillus californicus]
MPRTSTRSSTRLPRGQPGIQNFARATKPGLAASKLVKDRKTDLKSLDLQAAPATAPAPASTARPALPVSPSKKRKLNEIENVECIVPDQGREQDSGVEGEEFLTPSKPFKFSALSVSTPKLRSGHYAASSISSPSPSPSKRQARTAPVTITEDDENIPSTPSKHATATARAKTTPKNSCRESFVLATPRPACVEELVKLYSSFLKALTIHVAHSGLSSPADLREFLPSVTRIWKKRKVVVKDLQRLLWISAKGSEPATGEMFRLANHGLGRVCLERVTGRGGGIDEAELQARFEESVELLWEKALDGAEGDEDRVDFVATLGVVSIQESLAPFTAFRKGQQRLQDLKGGVIRMKMEGLRAESVGDETTNAASPSKIRGATTNRRQGLLERIKSKELLQAKLPPPPSKDTLLIRAAAGRVEEVAGVLAHLRPVGYVGSGPTARMTVQRTPFCLDTIVRHVQDSTRNPVSSSEVESCLDILSREDVAGHWVSIVIINQLKSVVLKSSGDVQVKDIGPKVAQLKIGWDSN